MKVPEFVIEILREIGQELVSHPEKFYGKFSVNSNEGGVTHFNIEVSYRKPVNGKELQAAIK